MPGEFRYQTFEFKKLRPRSRERAEAGPSYNYPHLFFKIEPYTDKQGQKVPVLGTLENLYAWYPQLVQHIGNKPDIVSDKAKSLCEGLTKDEDRLRAVFYWIQDNIRYIAFEDGLAGFQPESCQMVLGNGFGDCKGMANLLVQMLKTQQIHADLCWLGTRHVAYYYSEPSLASDNHMIARVKLDGTYYFLDPTEDYIALGDYAHRIQGRPVMVENKESYVIDTIPDLSYERNLNETKLELEISGKSLTWTMSKTYRGESRTSLLRFMKFGSSARRQNALERILKADLPNSQLSNILLDTTLKRDLPIHLSAKIQMAHQIIPYDSGIFILLHTPEVKNIIPIKDDRNVGLNFSYKIFDKEEIRLRIPENYRIGGLPPSVSSSSNSFQYQVSYRVDGKYLIYQHELIVYTGDIPSDELDAWREMLRDSKSFNTCTISY